MDIIKTQQHEQEWIRIKKRGIAFAVGISAVVGLFAVGCAVLKHILDKDASPRASSSTHQDDRNGRHQASNSKEDDDLPADEYWRGWEHK